MKIHLQITDADIFQYFTNSYGEIESIQLISTNILHNYPTITFVRTEDASKALTIYSHVISNIKIWLTVADIQQERTKKLPALHLHPNEIPSTSGLNLLDLNEDCLYEILYFLPIPDLSIVANSCKYLKLIAQNIFNTKYKTLSIGSTIKFANVHLFDDAVRILVNFGSFATKLIISFKQFKQEKCNQLIHIIATRCQSLTSLEIHHLTINKLGLKKFQKICAQLNHLLINDSKIYKYYDDKFVNVFGKCDQLIKLNLCNFEPIELLPLNYKFSKLESFTFKHELRPMYTTFLKSIFSTENQLKKLNFMGPFSASGKEIPLLSKNCSQLEKLYIHLKCVTPKRFEHFQQFQHIKKLKINCDNRNISKFFINFKSVELLEYIELENGRIDQHLFDSFYKCTKLRTLCLLEMTALHLHFVDLCNLKQITELILKNVNGLKNDILIELVDGLNRLEILTLINCGIVLSESISLDIGRVCRNRQDSIKLVIHRFERTIDEAEQLIGNDDNEYFKIVNYTIDE